MNLFEFYKEFQKQSAERFSLSSPIKAQNKSEQICKRNKKRSDVCHSRCCKNFLGTAYFIFLKHICFFNNFNCPSACIKFNR